MNNKIKQFTGIFLLALLFNACKPDDDFLIGSPSDRIQQLSGTWKLNTVTQIDLNAKRYNFSDPTRPETDLISADITNAAPFTDVTLILNTAGNATSTFTANYGGAPKIFKLTSGNWKLDNDLTPGKINFISGTDTTKTTLGGINQLSAGMLTIQVTKYQGTKTAIQYNYNFKKN